MPKPLLIVSIALGYLVAVLLLYSWINRPSSHDAWLNKISDAEARWQASNISSYELTGQATWGWHQHSFEISVVNGQIASSKCVLGYDALKGDSWCSTEFDASAHLVPALFERARALLEFGDEGCPQEDYFKAEFNWLSGVPTRISLDCPEAYDEEQDWRITFTQKTP